MGVATIFVILPINPEQTFVFLTHSFGFDWPIVLKMCFENGRKADDDGQWRHWCTKSSPKNLWVSHIPFYVWEFFFFFFFGGGGLKGGGLSYTCTALKKGAIRHAHQHYVIYRKLTPPPPHPPPPPPPPPEVRILINVHM